LSNLFEKVSPCEERGSLRWWLTYGVCGDGGFKYIAERLLKVLFKNYGIYRKGSFTAKNIRCLQIKYFAYW